MANNIDLSIDFCGVKFKNPFLLSSSPVSNSAEMVARSFDAGWSGVVFKTLNSDRLPIIHPSPRMACTFIFHDAGLSAPRIKFFKKLRTTRG